MNVALKRSKQSGYCGPYLIEMWSETAEDPAAEVAAKARDWVKAHGQSGHGGGGIMQKAKNSRCLKPTWIQAALWAGDLYRGNVSAIDRERGLVVIKPSGVAYETMKADDMVVVDMSGKVVEGEYRPSSDTATHLELYRRYPSLGGIVHTTINSCYRMGAGGGWRSRRCTTHADYFLATFRTRGCEEEVQGEYELNTGKVIIETLGNAEPLHTPGIVVYQHGPFAWGKDAHDAVHNAVVMEEVAKMAWIARGINPQLNHIDSYLMNKHFMRKHGPNAYYGQK